MAKAIQVHNVSKQYRLGQIGTGSMAHDLNRWWHSVRGKEDPYLQIGEANDRTKKGSSDYVWSLKDVSFDIEQGDSVGIIGRNGAGKSTLLKILSRVTAPTTGNVKVKGRIASLLEVGTGFHPDLSGRDNIYLNGAILGMRKVEIKKKFDEIVDFAGVERYIDTPVKRYSSGMYVRLAFAVAAYLESEILIVDEVLAVGDAEFQKKCLGKMGEVSKGEGRTILFVSHNMGAINQLCKKAIVLSNGKTVFEGKVNQAINQYLNSKMVSNNSVYLNPAPNPTDIISIQIKNSNKENAEVFSNSDEITFEIKLRLQQMYLKSNLGLRVKDHTERIVFTNEISLNEFVSMAGEYKFEVTIPKRILVPNEYIATITIHVPNVEIITSIDDKISFEIEETGSEFFQYAGVDYGCVFVDCLWSKSTDN